MLYRRHLLLQHTDTLAPHVRLETGWHIAVQKKASCRIGSLYLTQTNWLLNVADTHVIFQCAPQHTGGAAYRRERRGFPVCTTAYRRCSVPPRETRFSGLYQNKPVVLSGHKRLSKRSTNKVCHPKKPRKEEEPSSTAAHSPTCTDHIAQTHTAHPKHFFGAAKRKYLAFARYRGAKPPHGGPRVRPTVNSPCV